MRILITNGALSGWTGSELYARDIARGLRARGHEAALFSPRHGPLASELRGEGFPVVRDLRLLPWRPEVLHAHHNLETLAALSFFPGVPAVYVCHGTAPGEEFPPRHPGVRRIVAVSAAVAAHLAGGAGVPPELVTVVPNFVDTARFPVRAPLPARPARALVFNNDIGRGAVLSALRRACAAAGLSLDVRGVRFGHPTRTPERELGGYDVVFAIGRSALEGMATGAAVILCSRAGLGEAVVPGNLDRLRLGNFGRAVLTRRVSVETVREALADYDPAAAAAVRDRVRAEADLGPALARLLALYEEAVREAPGADACARPAVGRIAGGPRTLVERLDALEARLARRLARGAPSPHLLLALFRRARRRRPGPWPPPAAAPGGTGRAGIPSAAGAELACVVICRDGGPAVADAVASLAGQDAPCEILVVSSGGASPEPLLRAAGLAVPVAHHASPLLPGAARNAGVARTSAPYVAFLAETCRAEPGWVRARLERHRAGAPLVASALVNADPSRPAAWAAHLLLYSRRLPRTPERRALRYGVSFSRALLERVGPFREDLRVGEDTELLGRARACAEPAWAPEVRTAHRNPGTLRALLADQRARGARSARAWTWLAGRPMAARVAAGALLRALPSVASGLRATGPGAGWQPWAGALLAPLGALAYAAGAWASSRRPDPDAALARPPRIVALCQFRNEARFLPGYLENLRGKVDGLIALDDGSTDGSAELVAADPLTRCLIRLPPREEAAWDEPANHRRLVEAALGTDADWLIALDADERLEDDFRRRALAELARAGAQGRRALSLRVRELWDGTDAFRADGIWGAKRSARLFRNLADNRYDTKRLHRHWAPLNGKVRGAFPAADLILYHLRMVREEDRRARRDRYVRLDPERRWQKIGYEYLTDARGLRLEPVPSDRGFGPRG